MTSEWKYDGMEIFLMFQKVTIMIQISKTMWQPSRSGEFQDTGVVMLNSVLLSLRLTHYCIGRKAAGSSWTGLGQFHTNGGERFPTAY